MRRLVIVVSAALLAASSVNRANSPGNNVPLSPSALVENTTVSAMSGAGKGRKDPTTSSLTLVMVSDINGDGLPNWGDSVTFDVSTTEAWNQVNVTCYQNGVGVFGAVLPWTPVVTLSSTAWRSGAADCTAELMAFAGRKTDTLALLNFPHTNSRQQRSPLLRTTREAPAFAGTSRSSFREHQRCRYRALILHSGLSSRRRWDRWTRK
jgi:hypothetical protein